MTQKRSGFADTNSRVSALLQDLAAVQTTKQSRWGYERAAAAVFALEEPLESLVQSDGTLRKIPNVGPSSTRVILEFLQSGDSPTVEHAVGASSRAAEVARSRSLRTAFLSRAQVVAALADPKLRGLRRGDYRGDLQMHSVWSDGAETLAELAASCVDRGYEFCAVTDHSYGLQVARGMSMENAARQHREITVINRTFAGRFRMIKGVEANILADGEIDLTKDERRQFEIVLAAPHAKLRKAEDQTDRMLAAVRLGGVHILAHPRGRQFGTRAGVIADWDRVFKEAARREVAIEIDGDPARQDIDFALAPRALKAGCIFSLDSDAHSSFELRYADTSIAHARLAGIPKDRIINCWPVDELLRWAKKRSVPS